MNNMLKIDYRAFDLAELAIKSMLYEVSSYPSPGLVSPVSNGAHKDMNYYTFIKSTSSLIKPMIIFANEGFNSKEEKNLFLKIRKDGQIAEKYMMVTTKGINTHRGMLFLMGTTIAATAFVLENKLGFNDISTVIKNMCAGIVEEELKSKKLSGKLTHGELLYKNYKFTGIRGEVENGLDIVFNYSLPFYEELKENSNNYLNERERLVHTLIAVMAKCDDSTIVYRHNFQKLEYVKAISKEILYIGGMKNKEGQKKIDKLNKKFIKENISPGGSADLLAITVFLYNIKRKFFS